MRLVFALPVLMVVWCAATPVHAKGGGKEEARRAYKEGIQHYNLNEFAEALASFKEAYRNFEDPTFLFNIGQCERQLGNKVDAVRSYRAYLRERADAPNRAEVERLITSLDESIKQDQETRTRPPQGPLDANGRPPAEPQPTEPQAIAPPPPTGPSAGTTTANDRPVHKKWWLWTIVGGVVVAGAAVGLGVGLSSRSPSFPSATTSDGAFRF